MLTLLPFALQASVEHLILTCSACAGIIFRGGNFAVIKSADVQPYGFSDSVMTYSGDLQI